MELEPVPGSDWTTGEIAPTIQAYFSLLLAELRGTYPVKASAVRALRTELPARTTAAIEYKFSNISAVLDERGLPWVEGYKPQSHYQQELRDAVDAWLASNPGATADLVRGMQEPTGQVPGPLDPSEVEVEPPSKHRRRPAERRRRVVGGWRGALSDERNRLLGERGEQWVVDLERFRLIKVGREDLAGQVRWASKELGDGLGYDIESFAADGARLLIEVKTTNLGINQPFIISIGEVDCSRRHPDLFRLYRVFDFSTSPRYYVLSGAVDAVAHLDPVQFRGLPKDS